MVAGGAAGAAAAEEEKLSLTFFSKKAARTKSRSSRSTCYHVTRSCRSESSRRGWWKNREGKTSKEEADKIKKKLEAAGAVVEIK
jgi:hypothetical protein